MEAWQDVILLAALLGLFACGFFIMRRLGGFADENRKAAERQNEPEEPACILLTAVMSDEEIAEEIRNFRKKHKGARIVLYGGSDTALSGHAEHAEKEP